MSPVLLSLLFVTCAWACQPLDGLIDPGCPAVTTAVLTVDGPVPFGGLRLIVLSTTATPVDLVRQTVAGGLGTDPNQISLTTLVANMTISAVVVSRSRVLEHAERSHFGPAVLDYLIVCPGVGLARLCPLPTATTLVWAPDTGATQAVIVLDLEWTLAPTANLPVVMGADLASFFHAGSGWTVLRAANATGAYVGLTTVYVEFATYDSYLVLSAATDRSNYPVLGKILSFQRKCPSGVVLPLCEGQDALDATSGIVRTLQIGLGVLAGAIVVLAGLVVRLRRQAMVGVNYLTKGTSV